MSSSDERFGIYPHAVWHHDAVRETGRGYVVRSISGAVPYGRMIPVRIFKRKHAAEKFADKINELDLPRKNPKTSQSSTRTAWYVVVAILALGAMAATRR